MTIDRVTQVVLDQRADTQGDWRALHQCLLMLQDSPLNHAGRLAVFIKLLDQLAKPNRALIRMHRETRIPRTYKRFEQLFENLLKGTEMPLVQTRTGQSRLLEFVKGPLDKLLPESRCRISNLAPRLRSAADLASGGYDAVIIDLEPVDFNILGDGRETDYEIKTIERQSKEDSYSLSRYPISPAMTCVKITTALERLACVS